MTEDETKRDYADPYDDIPTALAISARLAEETIQDTLEKYEWDVCPKIKICLEWRSTTVIHETDPYFDDDEWGD